MLTVMITIGGILLSLKLKIFIKKSFQLKFNTDHTAGCNSPAFGFLGKISSEENAFHAFSFLFCFKKRAPASKTRKQAF